MTISFSVDVTPITCTGCGRDFYPTGNGQSRCTKGCNKKSVRGNSGVTKFIAVDGEGVTNPETGEHKYVLLSVGDQSLHRDGRELTTHEIFAFLWKNYNPRFAYVGFFLGYDFTMWLKGLPPSKARKLLTTEGIEARRRDKARQPFPVDWNGWEFDSLGLRRFKLRPIGSKKPWMVICDAGSFFQASFLSVIDPKKWSTPILSQKEWETIVEGKSIRSDAVFDEKMVTYNVTENRVMARLMEELDKGFMGAKVFLNRSQWFGPGQPAKEWLDQQNSICTDELHTVVPPDVLAAARDSYYGGWFDIMAHGHIPGKTFGYDINSAYPMAISKLPCLKHGKWVPWRKGDGCTALVYAVAEVKRKVGGVHIPVLPHRDKHGHILRPLRTEGWFWHDELLAASTLGTVFHVKHGWSFVPGCDELPYAAIEDLYYERLRVGKNTPHGMANKLLINSCYGKFAQSVGSPRHGNPIYASMITSVTRQMIITAISTHPRPQDVVMVATDGVYFMSKHPHLELSASKLGAWDEDSKDNLTLFMPGVYWDDGFRKDIKAAKLRSRGVSARDLAYAASEVDDKFNDFNGMDWPGVRVPISFGLLSAKQALHRNNWQACGRIVSADRGDEEAIKILSSNPKNKRYPVARNHDGIWRTVPYDVCSSGQVSVPYERQFGIVETIYNGLLTPDGDAFSGFKI